MLRRRKRDHVAGESAEVQIPIPAMLDMVFQILSFFVINFNPPNSAEGQVDLYLPTSGQAKAASIEQADPFAISSDALEPTAEVTLIIGSNNGGLGQMTMREKEKTTELTGGIKSLREELSQLQRQLGRIDVKIEANGALRYSALVEVIDAALAAKIQSIGFSPPPRPERAP